MWENGQETKEELHKLTQEGSKLQMLQIHKWNLCQVVDTST